jgi:glutathione S-transferase
MVTLYGSGPAYGVNDLSPFVVKVAAYCHLAGIEYTQKPGNPRTAPKNKIPYLRDGDTVVCDSSAIIDHLRAKHRDLDEGLTAREKAIATAVKAMFEEHYYFCIMYQRWQDERGWAVQEPTFQAHFRRGGPVPGIAIPFVVRMIRTQAKKMLHAQGTGRHTVEEVEAIAKTHLDAVSELLGDGDYFFGAAPRSLDATVWAFLACTTGFTSDNGVRAHLAGKKNLAAYVDRIRERHWKEG